MEEVIKYTLFVLYFVLIVGMGIKARRQAKTVSGFVVGERSISPAKTAFSYAMANFSAGIFIGFSGFVGWNYGVFAIAIGLAASTFIGTYLPWKILADRIRKETDRTNTITIPSYLEARYSIRNIQTYSSILMFIFFIPYAASLLMGLSFLFEQVFGINYVLINALMAFFVGFYLLFGGYRAITSVDFVQGIITLGASILVVLFVVNLPEIGGPVTGTVALYEMSPGYIVPDTPMKWFGILSLLLATGLGPWGMPDMLQRFLGVSDGSKAIKLSRIMCVSISVVICVCACSIGAFGHLFFDEIPSYGGTQSVDLITPLIITKLPTILSTLFIILILSASMSTLAALCLSASTSIVIDFIKAKIKPTMSDSTTIVTMRLVTVLFIAAALLISLKPPAVMLNLIQLTIGAVAGTFLAPLLWGLYSKNVSKIGVIAGMVVALATTVLGFLTLQTGSMWLPGALFDAIRFWGMPFFTMQAIIFPIIVIPLVGKFSKREKKEIDRIQE